MTKRVFFWKLPLLSAIVGVAIFASGFALVLRGDLGVAVNTAEASTDLPRKRLTSEVRMVILGDSLARGTGDESGLGIAGSVEEELVRRKVPHKPTVKLAVNGYRTADVKEQLQSRNVRRLIAEANVVILSIGGNDLFGGVGSLTAPRRDPEPVFDRVLVGVKEVVKEIRAANPRSRIYLVGLYNPFVFSPDGARLTPFVNRWNARISESFQSDSNITIVQTSDIFSHQDRLSFDRFHPGAEAYRIIGRRIAESL